MSEQRQTKLREFFALEQRKRDLAEELKEIEAQLLQDPKTPDGTYEMGRDGKMIYELKIETIRRLKRMKRKITTPAVAEVEEDLSEEVES